MSRQFTAIALWHAKGPFVTTDHDGAPFTNDQLTANEYLIAKDALGDFFIWHGKFGQDEDEWRDAYKGKTVARFFRDYWKCWGSPLIACGDDGLPTAAHKQHQMAPYDRALFAGTFTRIF